ncbi:MAG: endolytic transglycosylase MltG [Actinomycetia bacterium]|nr:endolytic transglycosylase MltG [Actinomycetes bacterium]
MSMVDDTGSDIGSEEADYLDWDEDDFVTVRPGGYRILRALIALVVLVAIGWFLYSSVRGWFESQLDPEGDPGEAVTLIVPNGATTGDIAELLEANEIVPNSTFFRYFAEWKGHGNFQAGEYQLNVNSPAEQAIAILNLGPIPPVYARFGVPEGLWVSEMLPRIADDLPSITAAELQAVLDSGQIEPRYRPSGQTSWEGLLFPAFYEIEDDAEPIEVLAKMSNEFARVTGELGYGAAETKLNMSAYEVIIVASMVEAEAKTEGDRPKIARVIYNRLREQMSLDIDATCIYGTGIRGFELTREILDDSELPYACRKHPSLPPTPIAAPGRASLEAAIDPAEGDWLFYVLKDIEGNHFFTDDIDEFNEQKAKSIEEGLF